MPEITDPDLLAQLNATGEDFLKTLPPERAAQVKALAEGRMSLPSGYSLRSPVGQQLLADVAQYDPTFDVANAPARMAARKAFTSGAQGKNITSFNTAIGHLGTLAKNAEELGNTSIVPWNSFANWVSSATGNPEVTNFNVAKQAVVDELERAFKGTGGNVHEIRQWEETLNSSRSPEQLRGAIKQAADLLHSRIGAMQDSYNAAMGTTDQPLPMLNEHASDTLRRFESSDYLNRGYGAILSAEHGGGSTPPPASPINTPTPPDGSPPFPGGMPPMPGGGYDPQLAKLDDGSGSFATDKDREYTGKIERLLATPGAKREDFDALSMQYGYPKMGADLDRAIAYRAQHPNAAININGPESGHRDASLLRQIGNTAAAAGIGAADAASFGTLNKITAGVNALGSRLGGDNRALGDIYSQNLIENNLKTELSQQAHPIATLAGETAGFMAGDRALGAIGKGIGAIAPGAAALTGNLIRPGMRGLAQDAAYGAAYGAGSSDTLADVPGNALTGAALGGAGGALGRGVARGVAGVLQPTVSPVVRRLTDAGVSLTPSQIMGANGGRIGRAVKGAEDWLSGLPGIGGAIKDARKVGVEDFNRAALDDVLEPIGQQADGVGHAGIADAQAKVSKAYDDAIGQMQAVPDAQLTQDLTQVSRDVNSLSESHRQQFNNIMDTDLAPYLAGKPQLDGADLQAVKQGLDRRIANLRGQGSSPQDRDLADHLESVRDAVLDNAARTDPQAAEAFQKANQAYSLLARVEDAASKTKEGIFTPNQFRTAVGRRGYGATRSNLARGSAPFQQLSTDASTVLPSTIPDSGTAGRNVVAGMLGMHGAGAALGGATGYAEGGAPGAIGGTIAGAALGSAMFGRPGVRITQSLLAGNRGRKLTTLADVIRANSNLGGAIGTPLLLQKLPE